MSKLLLQPYKSRSFCYWVVADQVSLQVFLKREGDQLQEIVAISFKVSDVVNTSVTFKL